MTQTLTIPNNQELEETLLGDLLLDQSAIYKISGVVSNSDFFYERNRVVFDAIIALDRRGEAVDFQTVLAELARNKRGIGIDGAHLARLISSTPTALNVETHAREIANLSGKRKIIELSMQMADNGYNGRTFDECLTDAQSKLLAILPKSRRGATDIDSIVADRVIEYRLRDAEPRNVAGVATGYAIFDSITRGLGVGLHVWQAETHNGKTTLALNVIAKMAQMHTGTAAMLSLEMPRSQLVDRFVSMECGVNSSVFQMGQINGKPLPDEIIIRRDEAARRVSQYGTQIEEVGGMQVADIRSRIIYHKLEHGIDIAFVDYIQKVPGRNQQNRNIELDEVTRILDDTANELGIPIVATSQVSRDKTQRGQIPTMDRARDSGGIEQNAGCVASIVYEDRNHPFDSSYTPDHVITWNGLKDRLHGVAVNVICGFRIDSDTGKLNEITESDLRMIMQARKK